MSTLTNVYDVNMTPLGDDKSAIHLGYERDDPDGSRAWIDIYEGPLTAQQTDVLTKMKGASVSLVTGDRPLTLFGLRDRSLVDEAHHIKTVLDAIDTVSVVDWGGIIDVRPVESEGAIVLVHPTSVRRLREPDFHETFSGFEGSLRAVISNISSAPEGTLGRPEQD